MTHDELKSLLALAALERLEPQEAASLREHLAGCDECDAELRELEHTAAMFAFAADAPGENRVASKIEARLAGSAPAGDRAMLRAAEPSRRDRSPSLALRLALAATLLLTLYGAGVTSRLLKLQRGYDDRGSQLAFLQSRFTTLQAETEKSEQRVNALAQSVSERAQLEQILDAPDLQITHLSPLHLAPGAHAMVALSRASGFAFISVSGLSPAPEGETYELWWITRQKGAVAGGQFNTEAGREVIAKVDIPPPGVVLASEVTLENSAGEAQKPGKDIFLKGSPERE
jgi:hypothetical protein